MARHWTNFFSFSGAAIRSHSMTYLAMVSDECAHRKLPSAHFTLWDESEWRHCEERDWNLAGIAVSPEPLKQMIAVSEWGDVLCVGSGSVHDEHVTAGQPNSDDLTQQPRARGPLCGVRRIGSHIYAVGADRQAYRREGPNHWTSFGPPGWREQEPDARVAASVASFEAIDGFSESDLYAVGWDGEVWNSDGQTWRPLTSPTNRVLVDVCCGADGFVYACGREGLLLRGRHQRWIVVPLRDMTEDILSLAWFGDHLYLSTMSGLYQLEGNTLTAVDFGSDDPPKTCNRLSTGDGTLWSVGAKDVMVFDGKAWERVD